MQGSVNTPKAVVKPQVLTHVIDGHVIKESSTPFPVSPSKSKFVFQIANRLKIEKYFLSFLLPVGRARLYLNVKTGNCFISVVTFPSRISK